MDRYEPGAQTDLMKENAMTQQTGPVFLCGVGPVVADTSDCPNNDAHTPSPSGYIGWHEWAEEMGRTHRQYKCPGCKRYAIWKPKPAKAAKTK